MYYIGFLCPFHPFESFCVIVPLSVLLFLSSTKNPLIIPVDADFLSSDDGVCSSPPAGYLIEVLRSFIAY